MEPFEFRWRQNLLQWLGPASSKETNPSQRYQGTRWERASVVGRFGKREENETKDWWKTKCGGSACLQSQHFGLKAMLGYMVNSSSRSALASD